MAVKVRVNQQDFGNRIIFGFFKEGEDPNKTYIYNGKDAWEEYKFGDVAEVGKEKFTLVIPPEAKDEVLQQLADLIWALGFKPQRMKATTQELERVENHLLDTIAIRDRLLSLVEKKGVC